MVNKLGEGLSDQLPLKQGLKHEQITKTDCKTSLSDQLPLKQGLKQYSFEVYEAN